MPQPGPKNELQSATASCRSGLVGVFIFSAIMNVLLLTGPFYMLQIYDRVLTSQSLPTLVALSILVAVLLGLYGLFDWVRGRLMTRLGNGLDLHLADRAYGETIRAGVRGAPADPSRDLRTVRQFLAGPAAAGLFDLPWMPAYVAVIWLLHPVLGALALAGAIFLVCLAIVNALMSRKPSAEASALAFKEDHFLGASKRNGETIQAMGMLGALQRSFASLHEQALTAGQKGSDRNGIFAAPSKAIRMILQSAVLGVGAYLVIQTELSPGAMIAASIIFARALAPVDMAIAQWRSVVAGKQAWARLKEALAGPGERPHDVALPAPTQSLTVEDLYVGPPGHNSQGTTGAILVSRAALDLKAGEGLGIIGASGCGKSSLLKGLVGAWPVLRGEIRIDGATPDQWSAEDRGRFIGYLPQEVFLFDGTVAQNIARFLPDATSDAIISAARIAGAHELILGLPDGYETVIGSGGITLSAGQRQRVALARALYGDPFLVILDEPNAHIDAAGEAALLLAMDALKARGAIVIVVAHRKAAVARLDKLMVMRDGEPQIFGPKDEVLKHLAVAAKEPASDQEGGLRVVKS